MRTKLSQPLDCEAASSSQSDGDEATIERKSTLHNRENSSDSWQPLGLIFQ